MKIKNIILLTLLCVLPFSKGQAELFDDPVKAKKYALGGMIASAGLLALAGATEIGQRFVLKRYLNSWQKELKRLSTKQKLSQKEQQQQKDLASKLNLFKRLNTALTVAKWTEGLAGGTLLVVSGAGYYVARKNDAIQYMNANLSLATNSDCTMPEVDKETYILVYAKGDNQNYSHKISRKKEARKKTLYKVKDKLFLRYGYPNTPSFSKYKRCTVTITIQDPQPKMLKPLNENKKFDYSKNIVGHGTFTINNKTTNLPLVATEWEANEGPCIYLFLKQPKSIDD